MRLWQIEIPRSARNDRSCVLLLLVSIACMTAGCEAIGSLANNIGRTSRDISRALSGNTPLKAAKQLQNTESPDARREAINQLVEYPFGQKPPYTTRYQQLARDDPDYLVRATAIRALNRSRDATATPFFIASLAAPNDRVRLEAAKALTNVPDSNAQPALLKIVNNPDENRDVRIAAADALKHYKNMDVARTLIATLNGRDYAVAWQSRHSLKRLTGRDLRYNEAAWIAMIQKEHPFG
jgi:HEAT repeat protein